MLALAFALAFGVAYLVGAEDGGEPAPRTVTRGLSAPAPADERAEPLPIPALRAPVAPPATMAPAERPPSGGAPVTPERPSSTPDDGETEETLDI